MARGIVTGARHLRWVVGTSRPGAAGVDWTNTCISETATSMINNQTVSYALDRFAFGLIVLLLISCHSPQSRRPSIEFIDVPEGAPGGAARTEKIAGRVTGA